MKNFFACLLWQIQIEDHKVGTGTPLRFQCLDVIYRSLAIADQPQLAMDLIRLKRLDNDIGIGRVIFYQKNLRLPATRIGEDVLTRPGR